MLGGFNVIALAGAMILAGGLAAEVSARDMYVAPGATVRNADGSAERPWPGVAEALAAGAGGGDRLLLGAGEYGSVVISGVRADPPLEIAPVDPDGRPPRLTTLRVRESVGVSIRGLLVEGGEGQSNAPIVRIESDASGVTLEGLTVRSGVGHESWSAEEWIERSRRGILAEGPGASILGNRLSAVRHGITVIGPDARVIGNVIDGFSGDGIRGLGDRGLYEGNTIRNCVQVDRNHPDGFQSWARAPGGKAGTGEITGVVFRGNTIINHTGPRTPLTCHLQGIGLFDGMYVDWRIEDNLVEVDAWHGITVRGAVNTRVTGNVVRNISPGRPGPPSVVLASHKDGRPGANNLLAGNSATNFRTNTERKLFTDPNVTIQRDNRLLVPVQ
jgi:hypothetical protein